MVNSRTKGKVGEREAAKLIKDTFGVDARRGQQFSGSNESPDVVTDIEGVHFEVKRVERLDLYAAVSQAVQDAAGETPVVLHRRDRKEWLLTVRWEDLKELVRKLQNYVKP